MTPADVFYGRVAEVAAVRQATLDAAYRARPERFSSGAPRVLRAPAAVHVNPVFTESVDLTEPSRSSAAAALLHAGATVARCGRS